MPSSCIAIGCAKRYTKKAREEEGLVFHRLPKDPVLRDEWLKCIRRKNFEPSQTAQLYICSDHFLPSDYQVIVIYLNTLKDLNLFVAKVTMTAFDVQILHRSRSHSRTNLSNIMLDFFLESKSS